MSLHGYFDDSHDGSASRIAAIGGIIGHTEHWEAFDHQWAEATRDLTEPFHATDCEARRGCCAGWTIEQRNELMANVTTSIISSGFYCFGVVVPISEFRAVFPENDPLAPYLLAVKHAVFLMALQGGLESAEGGDGKVHMIHECDSTAARLAQMFRDFQSLPDERYGKHLSMMGFGSKELCPLQAADLIARETYKFADNMMSGRNVRKPVERLRLVDQIRFFPWNRDCLERLKSYGGPDAVGNVVACMTDNPPAGIMDRWPE